MKKTVVLGASDNPDRYSNQAVKALVKAGIATYAVGLREGQIDGVSISKNFEGMENVDTVSLYVGPKNQDAWMDAIIKLKPRRVIFNPGTECEKTQKVLSEHGIHFEHACTLVLLATQQY